VNKILYFDCETTGLDPVKHDIIQLALIIEVGGEVKERAVFNMQPFSYDNFEESALLINGYTIERLKTFKAPKEIYKEIVELLGRHVDKFDRSDKFYPAGFNVDFDLNFLAKFFIKNNDNYFGSWINWRKVDALPLLYVMDLQGKLKLENYKLETVCMYFGIPLQAHDAESDIEATRQVIKKVMEVL